MANEIDDIAKDIKDLQAAMHNSMQNVERAEAANQPIVAKQWLDEANKYADLVKKLQNS